MESAKIVCNQRERPRSEPAASEGSHGGMERPEGAIYRPGKPKRSLFTAERSVAVNKDASGLARYRVQTVDGGSVRKDGGFLIPGGSERMNAINQTSYPHGQLA